jgi:2',3'-cyclic-nucleotide 2'-phosphodiesterase (5'-nucleotidase family)
MIEAWNLAGLDYGVFGNHEFDFGPNVLLDRIHESNFSGWAQMSLTRRPETIRRHS